MRTTSFAETTDERLMTCLEEDERRPKPRHRLQFAEGLRELLDESSLAHVDDDRHFVESGIIPQRQLGKRRQHLRREIVDAEIAEVLERAYRVRLSRPGEPGKNDEPAVAGPPALARSGSGARTGLTRLRLHRTPPRPPSSSSSSSAC